MGGTDDTLAESGVQMEAEAAAARAVHVDRAERLQDKLALPVLVAALASVPAVFLTLFEGTAAQVGATVNTLSGAVLIGEAVVLLAVSEDRRAWMRRNRFLVLLAIVMIPAVVFAVGPVQLLRLVRTVGALRIIRARRILKAGKIVRERAQLNETWQRITGLGISVLVAGFVVIVLSDPTSQSRQIVDGTMDRVGAMAALLAGGVLAVATWVVLSNRSKDEERARTSTAEDS
jgi:CsoR family transcriptional regulator, copper-sensing transcriptional repressor